MSLDGVPYIAQYSPATPDIFVATGFNEWGMTSSMIAANILTDTILGKRNQSSETFTPKRSIWNNQFFINFGATPILQHPNGAIVELD